MADDHRKRISTLLLHTAGAWSHLDNHREERFDSVAAHNRSLESPQNMMVLWRIGLDLVFR